MKRWRYSRWDGTQDEFRLDARRVLDALSELLMEGLDVREALEWMRRQGFELAGLDMRVMGLDELMQELREEVDSLYERYRMDTATDDLRRRMEEILDREQRALERAHGFESGRMNDFMQRRHGDGGSSPTPSSASATTVSRTRRPGATSPSCSTSSSACASSSASCASAAGVSGARSRPTTRRRSSCASGWRPWSSWAATWPRETSARSRPTR